MGHFAAARHGYRLSQSYSWQAGDGCAAMLSVTGDRADKRFRAGRDRAALARDRQIELADRPLVVEMMESKIAPPSPTPASISEAIGSHISTLISLRSVRPGIVSFTTSRLPMMKLFRAGRICKTPTSRRTDTPITSALNCTNASILTFRTIRALASTKAASPPNR